MFIQILTVQTVESSSAVFLNTAIHGPFDLGLELMCFFFFFFFFVISSFYLSTLLSENVKLIHVFQYAISIPISRRTFNCSSPRSWYKCEIPFSFEMSYCLLINTSFKPWYLVPSYSHWNSCWSLSSILALFRYLFFPIFNLLSCITIIYTVSQFISF